MVNRSRTVRRGMQPALALRPWPALDQRSGLPRRSVAGCPVDVCASIGGRDRAARTWPAGPEATKTRPSLRLQPSPRRTGPAVALDEGCAPIACRLVALPSPASRPSTPRRAFSQPRAGLDTARRRPDRPGSSCIGAQTGLRAAIDPPAYPESAARRASVVRSARLRPVRSALSRLSAADQRSVRCDLALNPALGGPCRRLSARRQPLKLPGSRLRRPVRDPRHPHPGPPLSSRRGQGRARTHMPARAAWNFQKENPSEGDRPAPPPRLPLSSLGRRARRGHRFPCLRG